MDLLFDLLQNDLWILLGVTAVSIAIAVAAVWALLASLRKK